MICQIAAVVGMSILASFGSLFLKKATIRNLSIRETLFQPSLYIGGMLYVTSALLNYYLLKVFPLSFVVPIGALTYVWTLIISRAFLGESISARKIVGIFLIIFGVAFIAYNY